MDGYYYLHIDGNLIYKRNLWGVEQDLKESDFVKKYWPIDLTDRATAYILLVEAGALGAHPKRIKELAIKWNITDEDAKEFLKRTNGELRAFKDGNSWCVVNKDFVDIQESQCGFGDTILDALIEYRKAGL